MIKGIVVKEEEKEDNVVSLKLVQGGKEPPSFGGSDWLSKLEVGTVFFVESMNSGSFALGLFRLVKKDNKVIVLNSPDVLEVGPDGRSQPKDIYINPTRFCNQHRLYQEVGVLDFKQEEKEEEDDGDRGTVPSGGEGSEVERSPGEQGNP